MTRLQFFFKQYNLKYFNNSLPPTTVTWDAIDHFGDYGIEYKTTYKTRKAAEQAIQTGDLGQEVHHIRIGEWSKPQVRIWKMTLIHEMAHVKLRNKTAGHGPLFQREMLRLAKLGAFDELW